MGNDMYYISMYEIKYFYVYKFEGNYTISLLYEKIKPIPVAVRNKKWVCCRSLAGIAGSNPAGAIYISVFGVLCVVRKRPLRRADHSSRGVVPSVIVKPR